MTSTARAPAATATPPLLPEEARDIHTRLLRLALGVEESRAYWSNVDPMVPAPARPVRAFEERWFGAKSMERVRVLLANFVSRYDTHPAALATLRRWSGLPQGHPAAMDPATRRLLCHWHLQLADPIYRAFTGTFLPERRLEVASGLDRDVVLRWVQRTFPERWAAVTCVQFASKLLSAASEAGLVSAPPDPRKFLLPVISDRALGYLLVLLRGLRVEGTLLDNAYLRSVGLRPGDGTLEPRLRALPGLSYRRMAELTDLEFTARDLLGWADLALGGP
jgi:hypothetical protein